METKLLPNEVLAVISSHARKLADYADGEPAARASRRAAKPGYTFVEHEIHGTAAIMACLSRIRDLTELIDRMDEKEGHQC
jgi:hypothetical protein